MDRMIASMNPCCPTCKVSREVFWSRITAEASLVGLLETGHDLQVPPSELIIMTCHLAGDSIADRLQLRIVAFVMRDVRILRQWFVVVQQARHALPQLMDRIWLIRHSRFSNSVIFDSATNLIQLFLRFYGTISWWFGGVIFMRFWSNCKNTQRARPDKSPQLIGLSEVHNDTASPRSAPTAYRSNSVTLRTRDL